MDGFCTLAFILSVGYVSGAVIKCPDGSKCVFSNLCRVQSVRPFENCGGTKTKVCCPDRAESTNYQQPSQSNVHNINRPYTGSSYVKPSHSQLSFVDYYEDGYHGRPMSHDALSYLSSYRYNKQCGVRHEPLQSHHNRIATGYGLETGLTAPGEIPWHGALLRRVGYVRGYYGVRPAYSYLCGVTIIHPALLLTAAHCVRGYWTNSLIVKLGDWNLQGSRGERFPAIKRSVERAIIHNEYDPANYAYDVALIVVRPIDFTKTPHIAPACLTPKDFKRFEEHKKCYIVGWGLDVYKRNYGSNILKMASVSLLDDDDCKARLIASIPKLSRNFFHKSHGCFAGGFGKDACVGDGGGALVCPVSNKEVPVCSSGYGCQDRHYFVAGIVSYGNDDCGQENSVTGITDMVKLHSWIEDKLRYAGGFDNYDHSYWAKEEYAHSRPITSDYNSGYYQNVNSYSGGRAEY